jgi:hypothetical protein
MIKVPGPHDVNDSEQKGVWRPILKQVEKYDPTEKHEKWAL